MKYSKMLMNGTMLLRGRVWYVHEESITDLYGVNNETYQETNQKKNWLRGLLERTDMDIW